MKYKISFNFGSEIIEADSEREAKQKALDALFLKIFGCKADDTELWRIGFDAKDIIVVFNDVIKIEENNNDR